MNSRGGAAGRVRQWALMAFGAFWLFATAAAAQQVVSQPEGTIVVARGQTALLVQEVPLQRLSITDPEIAEVVAVSPQEILINGQEPGSTSLLIWDTQDRRHLYMIEVVPDTAALQATLRQLFPAESIAVATSGRTLILSGSVSDPSIAERILEVVRAAGVEVINNLQAPPAPQILLQVRFAEVTRNALVQLGTDLRVSTFGTGGSRSESVVETSSEGLLRLSLFRPGVDIEATISALQSQGLFRSLAEPNLLARNNEEASFLAGGEFPFPVVQTGATNSLTIEWKEFGVRLRFRPTVLPNGVIRLAIAPEVSSLDFSSGLRLEGFQIPSLLTRRAETEVEMREGQYLAIAGLMDNSAEDNITKLPVLGDIPILGELFRSREHRDRRTELLVLVTPRLVQPSGEPIPLPAGLPPDNADDLPEVPL